VLTHSGSRPTTVQILCPFPAGIQAYDPYHPAVQEQCPAWCSLCAFPRPAGKGTYCRQVQWPQTEWIRVRRFQCRAPGCKVTISLLPSFCVPFKRYSSAIIESCLDSVLRVAGSIRHWCRRTLSTDRSTAGSWVRQFALHSGLLSTEGCDRLGVRSPSGSGRQAHRLWSVLRDWAGPDRVLAAVQPGLCRRFPFLGLFHARL